MYLCVHYVLKFNLDSGRKVFNTTFSVGFLFVFVPNLPMSANKFENTKLNPKNTKFNPMSYNIYLWNIMRYFKY